MNNHCHFCGDEDPPEGHYEECRPDLFPHEIGQNCTWPGDKCYWDHQNPEGGVLDHMRSLTDNSSH